MQIEPVNGAAEVKLFHDYMVKVAGKVAIIGTRNFVINVDEYVAPSEITEVITGGARGVDTSAMDFATKHGIPLTVFKPKYKLYGGGAPFIRNREIVDRAEHVIAFWDRESKGTKYTVNYALQQKKPVTIIYPETLNQDETKTC